MPTMTYAEAAKQALAEEMRKDSTIWALGEDLGRGGVFGQYRGMVEEFGPERIVDTAISEAAILGAAVGAAMTGTRPLVEMRFADFALCAIDELVNQAAKARYMFGGQTRVPLVVREPIGMWRSSAAQHSQSLESWYCHIPGLVVVCPSTPNDNFGLMKSSLGCDDPVVFMEHKNLWSIESEVDERNSIPLGEARTAREGKDLTMVTWSSTFHEAMYAADALSQEGIDVEVIDLRTLWPWDKTTVLNSVEKTGRLLVAHEAVQVGGFGAEIVATVADRAFSSLRAPIKRIGAPRVPIPYAPPLEDLLRVTSEGITVVARELIRSGI
ncbi:MAG: alpha-ketoacid dehydrogenase subunit beta [SAR324 cluster bacterium]|nr:alpha-ketoacid dehydrogenase subunit beta [SAR324 cluster bacterium]|tara:strand:+ start:2214 stop:3191 length:978 start_codon:yes stop_codon:yes gene_type:complete